MVNHALPPAPPGNWLLGHALPYARDPLGFLTRCASQYGDVVRLHGPGLTFCLLSHPDHIEQVLRGQHRNFIKWKLLRDTTPLLGDSLLTSEGDVWKRQRRLANPSFQVKQVQTYSDVIVQHTRRMLDTWSPGATRLITDDLVKLTLAIVARTLFDIDVEATGDAMGELLSCALGHYGDPLNTLVLPRWLPTPSRLRFRRAIDRLDAMIGRMIQQRRARGTQGQDLLSRLLATRDEDGGSLSDVQLRDGVVTLAFAGHKTTAAALLYSYYLLAQSPEADARLAAEAAGVLGGRPPTAADVPNLRFTECVVKEALRLYPPSWAIGREALEEFDVGGYRVPKRTQVILPQWVVQRDPRWFADAAEFRPERWADDLESRLPRCAYFPFGDGPRICIGGHFAMWETVLVLATVAQRFRLDLVPGQPFRLVPSITLWPNRGIRMIARPR